MVQMDLIQNLIRVRRTDDVLIDSVYSCEITTLTLTIRVH